jgi:hypothetical protein
MVNQASDAVRQPKVADMSGISTPGSKESGSRDISARVRTPVESPSDSYYDRNNADGESVNIDWASGDVSIGPRHLQAM